MTNLNLMRLDVFLKASRLCSRRTVANEMCDAGAVSVNGKPAKPAHVIKAGDQIGILRRGVELVVRVRSVPVSKQVSRSQAPELYTVLSGGTSSDRDEP